MFVSEPFPTSVQKPGSKATSPGCTPCEVSWAWDRQDEERRGWLPREQAVALATSFVGPGVAPAAVGKAFDRHGKAGAAATAEGRAEEKAKVEKPGFFSRITGGAASAVKQTVTPASGTRRVRECEWFSSF